MVKSGLKMLTKDLPYWLWIASTPSPGYGVNLIPNPKGRSIRTLVRLQASISIVRVKVEVQADAVTQLPLHALLMHTDIDATS